MADGDVRLRMMRRDDIAAVMAVERGSYSSGWPSTAFERVPTQNAMARYVVLEEDGRLAGFAGLWLMVDAAHIVTVGVLPERRGRGYGRLLVHGLISVAAEAGMENATL